MSGAECRGAAPVLGNPLLETGHQRASVQGAFFDQLSAQNTLDGGTAKDARFLDGFVVRAGDVLDVGRGAAAARAGAFARPASASGLLDSRW